MIAFTEEERGYLTPCHIFAGRLGGNGYGYIGRTQLAHRAAFAAARGPIPDGLLLDHLCRVPACVNPDHLDPVTHAENCRRGACAKITMAVADDIRRRRHAGEMVRDIAASVGLAQSTVSNIVAGRRWAA